MSKIIVILGPTATGKTQLSVELAKRYNADIICADATTIYKYVNIGTAKASKEEMDGIIHHMLDITDLNSIYTIYDYQKDGRKILDNLIKKNKNVIIVGGSGLYIKALLYDYDLNETLKSDIDLSDYSNQELKDMCNSIGENDIHINNRQRLERYIRYYKENNKVQVKTDNINKKLYDFDLIGLTAPREILYKRINSRVEVMFDNGLLNEAKELYNKKYTHLNTIIGYKELIKYFNNEISLDEAKELIKQNSRKYAKRQFTFFNHQFNDIKWFDVDYNNFNNTINNVINYIEK